MLLLLELRLACDGPVVRVIPLRALQVLEELPQISHLFVHVQTHKRTMVIQD